MADINEIKKKARDLVNKKEYEKAIIEYSNLLSFPREKAATLNIIGDIYLKKNDIQNAIESFKEAIDVYFSEGLYQNALGIVNKVLRNNPNNAEMYKLLSAINLEMRYNVDAETNLLKYAILALDDKNVNIHDVIDALTNFTSSMSPVNFENRAIVIEKLNKMGEKVIAKLLLDEMAKFIYTEIQENIYDDFLKNLANKTGLELITRESLQSSSLIFNENEYEASYSSGEDIIGNYGTVNIDNENTSSQIVEEIVFPQSQTNIEKEKYENFESKVMEIPIQKKFDGVIEADIPNKVPSVSFSEDRKDEGIYDFSEEITSVGVTKKEEVFSGELNINYLESYLLENPFDNDKHVEIAEIYLKIGNKVSAKEHLEIAKIGYFNSGELEKLYNVTNKLIEQSQDDESLYEDLVNTASQLQNVELLISALKKYADFCAGVGNYEKGYKLIQRILKYDPNDQSAIQIIQFFAEKMNAQTKSATATPKQEIPQKQPASQTTTNVKQPQQVVTQKQEKIVEKSTKSSESSIIDKDVIDIAKDINETISSKLSKEDYDSHYDMGVGYYGMGLYDMAINELKLAINGEKYKLKSYEMLGECYYALGKKDDALNYCIEGLKVSGYPKDQYVGLYYKIGLIYEEIGDIEKAYKYYVVVYKINSKFQDIVVRLKKIIKARNQDENATQFMESLKSGKIQIKDSNEKKKENNGGSSDIDDRISFI